MIVLVATRLEASLLVPEVTLDPGLVPVPWDGAPGPRRVRVAACGFGLEAAAAGATSVLAAAGEDAILVGLAGTLRPGEAPVGAVVGADHVAVDGSGLPRGAAPPPALRAELARLEPPAPRPLPAVPGVLTGGVLTVAVPSAGARAAAARAARHPRCLVEDMESHAVLHAARVTGRRVAVLRGVSNVAGDRRQRHWRVREAAAALRSALLAALEAW